MGLSLLLARRQSDGLMGFRERAVSIVQSGVWKEPKQIISTGPFEGSEGGYKLEFWCSVDFLDIAYSNLGNILRRQCFNQWST